jgi:hypothetical protein
MIKSFLQFTSAIAVIIISLILSPTRSQAQFFHKVPIKSDFIAKSDCTIESADFNNDGNEDILIAGKTVSKSSTISLYLNNKNGGFVRTNYDFEFISKAQIAIGDINGDKNVDIICTGLDSMQKKIAVVYLNNGGGDFTKKTDHGILPITEGAIRIEDLNNDGNPDVILTGRQEAKQWPNTVIFHNDGQGNFKELVGTTFIGFTNGSISIGDVDNNGEKDLLMTGARSGGVVPETKLYLNMGDDSYAEDDENLIMALYNSSSLLRDFDDDGDLDLMIMGKGVYGVQTKMYINDGTGGLTENTQLSFEGLWSGSIFVEDLNGDGLEDILLQGEHFNRRIEGVYVYLKKSDGSYTETRELITDRDIQSIALLDVDSDGDLDYLIGGLNDKLLPFTSFYTNNGYGSFTEKSNEEVLGLKRGAIEKIDFDFDGDLDILLSGINELDANEIAVLTNDGYGNFTKQTTNRLVAVSQGIIKAVNFQNDSTSEILICGLDETQQPITRLYQKQSQGFESITSTQLPNFRASSVSSSDFNNDQIMDLVVCGESTLGESFLTVFMNDSSFSFQQQVNLTNHSIINGSLSSGDINNDGWPDIFLMGEDSLGNGASLFYINNQNGIFNLVQDVEIIGLLNGRSVLEDFDKDGDLDLLTTGEDDNNNGKTQLYHNDGTGKYIAIKGTFLAGYSNSALVTADINRDGFIDFYVTGKNNNDEIGSNLYLNNQNGLFQEFKNSLLLGVLHGKMVAADFNKDGLMDIFQMGRVYPPSGVRLRHFAQSPISLGTRPSSTITVHKEFLLFPNPNTGQEISLSIPVKGNYSIEIFNNMGQLVSSSSHYVSNPNQSIQFLELNLSKGLYFVSISSEKYSGTQKLLIE